jgi:hypothetical protein
MADQRAELFAVSASHSPAVLSSDAVTMRLPSGLNAALATAFSWPTSGAPIGLPVAASHSRAVLSEDARPQPGPYRVCFWGKADIN